MKLEDMPNEHVIPLMSCSNSVIIVSKAQNFQGEKQPEETAHKQWCSMHTTENKY